MPIVSQALRRLRQETCEFRISPRLNVKSCLKANNKNSCVRALSGVPPGLTAVSR